ncbi:MAG: HAMP domain-containing protein, partial [Comamonadaceae bacterium]
MYLRRVTIGLRLAVGFSLILLAVAAMLAAALAGGAGSRDRLVQAVAQANLNHDRAIAMNNALMAGAVAARNMGLETKVEGLQKAQAEARKEQVAYAQAKKVLLAEGQLGADDRALFARLDALDKQRDTDFAEAVDLASQFNTEQAADVIVRKVDPALRKARTEIDAFIASQRKAAAQAMEDEQARGARSQWILAALGLVVIALSALFAWLLTRSITGPLRQAEEATSRVAAGDLSYRVDASGNDEVAALLASLNRMADNLSRLVQEVRGGSDSIATGSSQIATGNSDRPARPRPRGPV